MISADFQDLLQVKKALKSIKKEDLTLGITYIIEKGKPSLVAARDLVTTKLLSSINEIKLKLVL